MIKSLVSRSHVLNQQSPLARSQIVVNADAGVGGERIQTDCQRTYVVKTTPYHLSQHKHTNTCSSAGLRSDKVEKQLGFSVGAFRLDSTQAREQRDPVALERIWKWGTPIRSEAPEKFFCRAPPRFGSKSTISHFGERFCNGQYSLVSFLFVVLLLSVPRVQTFVKVGARSPRAPWSRRNWRDPHRSEKSGRAHFDILERNEWSFRKTGTMWTLHGDPSGNRCLGRSTGGASARVRGITPEKFWDCVWKACNLVGRKLVRNAVHNTFLNTLTMATPFRCMRLSSKWSLKETDINFQWEIKLSTIENVIGNSPPHPIFSECAPSTFHNVTKKLLKCNPNWLVRFSAAASCFCLQIIVITLS